VLTGLIPPPSCCVCVATGKMSRNTVNLVQEDSGQSEEKIVAKTPVEVQRMKLAKLMSNP
ncbi:hypothetical protein QYM36_012293, partial [Artemia franciscana]